MSAWVACVGAFLIGGIPTAYLAGRWCRGVDVRQHGSGNVGATNAVRVLGKKIGIAVFVVDLLKGALPVLCLQELALGAVSIGGDRALARILLALCAVAGHVFTPFLGFKGGKGVATGAGALLAGFPGLFGICALVWVLVYAPTRVVSISSLAGLAALAVAGLWTDYSGPVKGLFFLIFVFLTWTHRSNISRLIRGEELSFKK
ncbi:MAG: Glycerol-3-phosphate acyltransferase [Candidatus Omnitrophica bacterium]|nr:Glycerol-3-phosphate acyltransferase [Candidatus Omnitrophota bacterium]